MTPVEGASRQRGALFWTCLIVFTVVLSTVVIALVWRGFRSSFAADGADWAVSDAGIREHVQRNARELSAAAENLLADPTAPEEADSVGSRWVIRYEGGRGVAVSMDLSGIPFNGWGLVYDPDQRMIQNNGSYQLPADGTVRGFYPTIYGCWVVQDHWYWCRVY